MVSARAPIPVPAKAPRRLWPGADAAVVARSNSWQEKHNLWHRVYARRAVRAAPKKPSARYLRGRFMFLPRSITPSLLLRILPAILLPGEAPVRLVSRALARALPLPPVS